MSYHPVCTFSGPPEPIEVALTNCPPGVMDPVTVVHSAVSCGCEECDPDVMQCQNINEWGFSNMCSEKHHRTNACHRYQKEQLCGRLAEWGSTKMSNGHYMDACSVYATYPLAGWLLVGYLLLLFGDCDFSVGSDKILRASMSLTSTSHKEDHP